MALLPNKHSGLISSCYLHRFARYALPCSRYLLSGLQAQGVQQIKQHNSSVQAPPELVTADRVVCGGHPRHSADLHSPIYLRRDKWLVPAHLPRTPSTVGGLCGRQGASRAGEGDTEGQQGLRGGECARAQTEQHRGSTAPSCSVPALWIHSWTPVPAAKAPCRLADEVARGWFGVWASRWHCWLLPPAQRRYSLTGEKGGAHSLHWMTRGISALQRKPNWKQAV